MSRKEPNSFTLARQFSHRLCENSTTAIRVLAWLAERCDLIIEFLDRHRIFRDAVFLQYAVQLQPAEPQGHGQFVMAELSLTIKLYQRGFLRNLVEIGKLLAEMPFNLGR